MLFTFALLQVWNHFDSGSCPGQAIGVKTRLDNGVAGFIPTKFLSDKVVKRPEERVKVWKGRVDFHISSKNWKSMEPTAVIWGLVNNTVP